MTSLPDVVEAPTEVPVESLPLPPLVSAPPFIGSLRGLTGNIRHFLTQTYREYGPVFRLRIPNQDIFVLAGPEANIFITKTGHDLFRSKESWQAVDQEMGATRSLISEDGPYHRQMRSLQKPFYAREKVGNNIGRLVDMTITDMREWSAATDPFSVTTACQRLITEQLGLMATGTSIKPYLNDLMLWIGTILKIHQNRALPRWWLRLPHVRNAHRRVMQLYRETVENRKGQPYDPTNIVDVAFARSREDPEFLPESDIVPLALGPFIAGLDTEASSTSFLLYLLLKHPDVMARATAEADALFAGEGPTTAKLDELHTLHRSFMEGLRLYPIAPALTRNATRDFAFQGYRIPKDALVIFGTTVSHYLDRFYPDPERFDPDRFTKERAEHRQPGAYVPFGVGPHVCLGAGLAEDQMVLNVATILHYVELEMVPADHELRLVTLPTPRPSKHFKARVRRWRHQPPAQSSMVTTHLGVVASGGN